jgi:hypothetical protein
MLSFGHRHLPSAGAHSCRHRRRPRCSFDLPLTQPPHRAGALPVFRPSPSFDGGKQDAAYTI